METMIRIGFDISTTAIGVCAMKNLDELIILERWEMPPYENKGGCLLEIKHSLARMFNVLNEYSGKGIMWVIGMELANFKNAKLTQRFARYAGIIEGMLAFHLYGERVVFKFFNANEWFQYLMKDLNIPTPINQILREDRKRLSIERANKLYSAIAYGDKVIDNDDIADAFNIAFYLHLCRDVEIIKQETTQRDLKTRKIKRYKKQLKRVLSLNDGIDHSKKVISLENKIRNLERDLEK